MANIKKVSNAVIEEAGQILAAGGTVVVPTDTNYNVVTSPFHREGVDRIFTMKGRDNMSPLTLFLGDSIEMRDYAYTTPLTEKLAKRLWPEKITFVLHQRATLPGWVTCGFRTVGVTLHKHTVLRRIANILDTPLAGTSANLSGTGNVPRVEKAIEHLGNCVDLIIDAGPSPIDSANTIIDFTFPNPILARRGAFPVELLLELIPNIDDSRDAQEYKNIVRNRAMATAV